jgi:lipoate-protein ligase A
MENEDLWYLLDSGPGEPAWNMAWDDALLAEAIRVGRPVLRFYGWTQPAATFGYFQRHGEIAGLTRLRPLIRRPTGGGLVPHDGDWTYSLTVPPNHSWYQLSAVESYQRTHEWLRRSLSALGVTTELAPCCNPAGPGQCFVGAEKYDLLLGAGKIAGAAQRRNRLGLLVQGSLQPPPPGQSRVTWQAAMVQEGPDSEPRRFEALPPGIQSELANLATSLRDNRYATRQYLEKR